MLGAVLVVFFLESTRFMVPLIPGLTRRASGGRCASSLISVALLVILRFYAKGLLPERIEPPPLTASCRGAGGKSHLIRRENDKPHAQDQARLGDGRRRRPHPAHGRRRRCARTVYREVERIAAETMGWRLFTVLRYSRRSRPSSASTPATRRPTRSAAASRSTRSRPATAPWRRARFSWRRPGRRCARPSSTTS